MSLSAREEQVLSFMEDGLARSDPRLASLLAIFTRLTSGEEMPVVEKIRAARRRGAQRSRRHSYRDMARRLSRRLGFRRTWMLWLFAVAAVALVAVGLIASRGGSRGPCIQSWSAACPVHVSGHSSSP